MATTYRLIGNDIDVFIDTDAANTSKEFYITDIRGEDPIDIVNGFDIGIMQYNEGQLVNFARDKGIELYSFDEHRKERCIVRQLAGSPAGKFNGVDSYLYYTPGVTLASSGVFNYPIRFEIIVRFCEADMMKMYNDNSTYYIFSTNTNNDSYFELSVQSEDETTLGFDFNYSDDSVILFNNVIVNNAADRCLSIVTELNQENNIYSTELSVDGISEPHETSNIPNASEDNFELSFGSSIDSGPTFADFFVGIIRNIKVSANNILLINTIDPSTGNNTVGDNGVPNNIESINVIMP